MTTGLAIAHRCAILDASCTLNLYASGQMAGILAAIPRTVVIAAYVKNNEMLHVNMRSVDTGHRQLQQVDLQPFVDQGLLVVVEPETEAENESYVDFAAKLGDDGESITAAIALHRNWAIAIDDRKASNLFRVQAPHLQLITTPELIRHWVDTKAPSRELIRQALEDVRDGARYAPGKQHPLYDWWNSY